MELAAVILPLIGAIIAGLFGRAIGAKAVNFITVVLMFMAAICSIVTFRNVAMLDQESVLRLFTWIKSGDIDISWSLYFDTLSVVMLMVVNIVSFAVHLYSVGYMHDDPNRERFMSYLGFFTFAMLMLITSGNFAQLFFGWEGVGLASYLLIGFWNRKESANAAAIKAFIMNRIGDFGLVLGTLAVYFTFGTLDFDAVFSQVAAKQGNVLMFMGYEFNAIALICSMLFIGAIGKSAQLGLHTWLPDAMEGPTPVSALIHAATMVTAGVFLIVRMSPLYEYAPDVLHFIAIIGATTALMAACIAFLQNDIKRIIAYSTMSQLGYMFFALGVSAYSAAMFHLFTHAFFKALLFLAAGSVIHAMHGEQDIRKMGGLRKYLPVTAMFIWIGSLALTGIPFFSGHYSKDMILEAALVTDNFAGNYAYAAGIVTALLTAIYSWRLIFKVFYGEPSFSQDKAEHIHESPWVMTLPMHLLAVGSIFAGWWFYELFVGESREVFWGASIFLKDHNDIIDNVHHLSDFAKKLPVMVAASGIAIAYILYIIIRPQDDMEVKKTSPQKNYVQKAASLPLKAVFSIAHKFSGIVDFKIDDIYRMVVKSTFRLGIRLHQNIDCNIIDRFGPNSAAKLISHSSSRLRILQSGYIYHYALVMVLGIFGFITAYIMLGVK